MRADAGERDAVRCHPVDRAPHDRFPGDGADRHLAVGVQRPSLAGAVDESGAAALDGLADVAVAEQIGGHLAACGDRGVVGAEDGAEGGAAAGAGVHVVDAAADDLAAGAQAADDGV